MAEYDPLVPTEKEVQSLLRPKPLTSQEPARATPGKLIQFLVDHDEYKIFEEVANELFRGGKIQRDSVPSLAKFAIRDCTRRWTENKKAVVERIQVRQRQEAANNAKANRTYIPPSYPYTEI